MPEEVSQTTKARILVACAAYGGLFYGPFKMSYDRMLQSCIEKGGPELHQYLITNESNFGRARNTMVATLIDNADYLTHLLIIDADMGWSPYRLERLLRFDKDIVGCPGPTKHIHWERSHDAILCGKDPESHCLRYPVNLFSEDVKCENGFAKVKDFGCCFCLIKTAAIMKMVESYPELKCEHMAWVDGKKFESPNTYMFFDSRKDNENRYLEGDHNFMALWHAIGGEVWADMTSDLTHTGTWTFRGNMGLNFFGRAMDDVRFKAIRTPIAALAEQPKDITHQVQDDKYHICIVRPPSNNFPLCFLEMAKLVQSGLQDLGMNCTRRENRLEEDRTNIVFGYHEWHTKENPLEIFDKYKVIVYQAEQIMPGGRLLPDWYYEALRRCHDVWDYSQDNIEVLTANGIEAKHVPPAYHPTAECIDYENTPKDIDVLFVGAVNPRRDYILKLLAEAFKVQVLCDVWGSVRDEYIAAAKLVLNIHYYHAQTLELLRLSHLLANRVPVVSEQSDLNPYEDGIDMVPYRSLWWRVVQLIQDDAERKALGERGYDTYRATSMVDVLSNVISVPCPTS